MTNPNLPPAAPRPGSSRWLLAAGALVVIGAVAMYFVVRSPRGAKEVRSAAEIRALTGSGVFSGTDPRFVWSRDPRADVYRLEVYDLGSHLLAAAVLRDTSILVASVLPDSARTGIWRVIPVSKGGTELPPTPNARFERP